MLSQLSPLLYCFLLILSKEKLRQWSRRRSERDSETDSDSGNDELTIDITHTKTAEHVGLARPCAAINPKRASEPLISYHTSTGSVSDPAVHIGRQGSELRVLASRIDRPISPNAASTDNPLGLTLVHCPPNPLFDLIFVHGLGGTSKGTWSYERDQRHFWPPWLADDIGLSACRTFTFGYNAAFAAQYSSAGILDFAKDLLFRMKTFSGESRDDGPQIGKVRETAVVYDCR
jgi:hypothetical protein